MEEGAGMPPCLGAPDHPQIQPSEDSAGATCRSNVCLHPQIEASEEGAGMTHRHRGTSPPATISLPDNEDMLREILLRLPPRPSSLPRASAVCKRWRCIVRDSKFHRQFYAHHRKPPLLGVFSGRHQGIVFTPVLDPPDHIPSARFSLGRCSSGDDYYVLNCRHGLVLVRDCERAEVVVCDPITGEYRRVAVPPDSKSGHFTGAVLCAAHNQGQVHGGFHSSSFNFKVVLISMYTDFSRPTACVYSSETGIWGNFISTKAPCDIVDLGSPATLVGNVLYWLCTSDCILEFDLGKQNLALTMGPPITNFCYCLRQIIQAEDGAVGFAMLAHPCLQMWQRAVNSQGVATWVPWKTIEMHNILGLSLQIQENIRILLGYDEDNDAIFVHASHSVYVVQLKSMHSKKLYGTNSIDRIHPFTSFYTPGTAINVGPNGVEMLHDT